LGIGAIVWHELLKPSAREAHTEAAMLDVLGPTALDEEAIHVVGSYAALTLDLVVGASAA